MKKEYFEWMIEKGGVDDFERKPLFFILEKLKEKLSLKKDFFRFTSLKHHLTHN